MTCFYKDKALMPGDLIPGTALTFVQPITRRRAEFRCACGKTKAYWLNDVESGWRLSCGCGCHRKLYVQDGVSSRHVNTIGQYPYPRMSYAVDLDSIDISRELEILGLNDGANCLLCSHSTYVHEYERYVCEKKNRMPFSNITYEPVNCPDFEEYLEEE